MGAIVTMAQVNAMLFADWTHYVFGPVLFLVALFLILLVLVQRGRGGGLTGALGGMGGQSAFGTKAGDVFTRVTMVTATVWILLCIGAIKILAPPPPRVTTQGSTFTGSGAPVEDRPSGGASDPLEQSGPSSAEPADPTDPTGGVTEKASIADTPAAPSTDTSGAASATTKQGATPEKGGEAEQEADDTSNRPGDNS